MTNPWLKKNPLMSLWLSGFNIAANSARSQAAAEMQRQATALLAETMTQSARFWTAMLTTPSRSAPRNQRRKRA